LISVLVCLSPLVFFSFPTRRSSDLFVPPVVMGRRSLLAIRSLGAVLARRTLRAVLAARAWLRELGDLDLLQLDALEPAALDHLRSEEHTSELQSRENLVCRLLLEKK